MSAHEKKSANNKKHAIELKNLKNMKKHEKFMLSVCKILDLINQTFIYLSIREVSLCHKFFFDPFV